MSEATAKRHMGLKTSRAITNTAIHVLLIVISIIWLVPFVCIVLQSFRVESTFPVPYVIPQQWAKGKTLETVTIPFSLRRSASLVTSPAFKVGETYTVKTKGYERTFVISEAFTAVRQRELRVKN